MEKPKWIAFRITEIDDFPDGTKVRIDAWDTPIGIWARMDKGVFLTSPFEKLSVHKAKQNKERLAKLSKEGLIIIEPPAKL